MKINLIVFSIVLIFLALCLHLYLNNREERKELEDIGLYRDKHGKLHRTGDQK
jgi:hypothetical protein